MSEIEEMRLKEIGNRDKRRGKAERAFISKYDKQRDRDRERNKKRKVLHGTRRPEKTK